MNVIVCFLFCLRSAGEMPFIPYVDSLPPMVRNTTGPFMMPIVDKYGDMGTVVMGKVESGECSKGQMLAVYPNRVRELLKEKGKKAAIFFKKSNCIIEFSSLTDGRED